MRYSNFIFTKGSIVFVRYPVSSDQAYLNGRPLVIVSNPTHLMNTVVVCTTGTRDKPGIEASFYNYGNKAFVGNAKKSNIYPYSMRTIYTDQIIESIGQLDPFIMQELDKAIDFHLGRTNEVPGYLKNIATDICGVTYNPANGKRIAHDELINPAFSAPYTYPNERRKTNNNSKKFKTPKKTEIRSDINQITNNDIIEWSNDSFDDTIKMNNIYKDSVELMKVLDERSVAFIVSRVVPIALIAKKYNVNPKVATHLRITLTNISVKIAISILNANPTSSVKISNSADYVVIGMILAKAFSPNAIKTNTSVYDKRINDIAYKYKMNTGDRRIWRSVEQFYCE